MKNKDLFQYVSMNGFKKNSPDRNNPFNIIPSGKITMKEDDGTPLSQPIMAVDRQGEQHLMQPGKNYNFGKGPILEFPMGHKETMFDKVDPYLYQFQTQPDTSILGVGANFRHNNFNFGLENQFPLGKNIEYSPMHKLNVGYRTPDSNNTSFNFNAAVSHDDSGVYPSFEAGFKHRFEDGGDNPIKKKNNNYFTYSGRPDAKYIKKNEDWYIATPDTNNQYVKIEDPSGSRTKLLNEQAIYHANDKPDFTAINDDILKLGDSISGGGYNKAFAGSGTPFAISHNGDEILPVATEGTYCSGYTCGVAMKTLEEKGMLKDLSSKQIKDFQKTWYGAKNYEKNKSETLSTKALEDFNLGKGVNHTDAKSGDIAQIWRNNGSGHSVIFKDWVKDSKGNNVGIKYRSSQSSTNGIGDNIEMFDKNINPKKIYIARLNDLPQMAEGGEPDPGNLTTTKSKNGTITNVKQNPDGSKTVQVKNKDGKYYEKVIPMDYWGGLNPYNWGVEDYSKYKTRGQAFSAARKAGEKEFMYNNQRFNTNYAGTPAQQLRETGITNQQLLPNNFVRDRISKNIKNEYIIGDGDILEPVKRVLNAVINNKSEKGLQDNGLKYYDRSGDDALNLYLGKPQKDNTFGVSKYKPTITKTNNNPIYYNIQGDLFTEKILREASKHKGSFQMTDDLGVLGQFTVDRGEDERGKYFSYYDTYDLNPYKGRYSNFNSKTEDISMGIGKPYEVYDRIYHTDNIERKKQLEKNKIKRDNLNKIQKEYYKHLDNYTTPNGMSWEKLNTLSQKNFDDMSSIGDEIFSWKRKANYNKVYYTNKELSALDPNKKDFDTQALQKELSNRGYKFPKSTTKEGAFDGIYGEETNKALEDWQKKNKKKGGDISVTELNQYEDGGEPEPNPWTIANKLTTTKNKKGTITNVYDTDLGIITQVKTKDGRYYEKTSPHLTREEKVDKYLGHPQKKAVEFSDQFGNIDNIRHQSAGRHTAEALLKKARQETILGSGIPLPDAINKASSWAVANVLGVGHEASRIFEDDRPWSEKLPESFEDIYNNFKGVNIGLNSDMNNAEKNKTIIDNSRYNRIPDGETITKKNRLGQFADPYDTNESKKYGGTTGEMMYDYDDMFGKLAKTKQLPIAQYGGEQRYTFSGRPDSQYKNVNGKWHIQNESTNNNFVEIDDPTGKRSAVLNKQAKPISGLIPSYQKKAWDKLGKTFDSPLMKMPSNMGEAQQMMDRGELDYESWNERKVRNKEEAEARKNRRVKSLSDYEKRFNHINYNQLTGMPGESFRDNLANEAESLDAKFRFSQEDNVFDDYLNPAALIGSMAKSLGEAPKKAKETDSYMPYLTSIVAPLAMGAFAGLGSATNRQFVNNIVNPAAGIRVPYVGAIKKALGTETGLLSKAHNLNPKAISKFDNPEMSYRVAGTDNYDDMLESAVLKSGDGSLHQLKFIDEDGIPRQIRRPTGFPSFQKGYADLKYMPEEGGVIFQTDLPTFKRGELNPVTGEKIGGRHYAHRVIDPETGMVVSNVSAADITAYGGKPHWWRGHEELYNPYKGIRSIDDINTGNYSDYLLGQKLTGNTGLYNQGIFQLKQFPDRVIKFEDPSKVAMRSNLPEYMDFDAVKATEYLPDNQGFAKTYNQLNFNNTKRGLIMPKLEGKSFEDMSRKEFEKWVDNPQTMEDLIQKQKILREQGLSFDFYGNGNMSVRPDGKVNVFDFEPFSQKKDRVKGDWWDLNVQGQTNPHLYDKSELAANHQSILEEKLTGVYNTKMERLREDLLKRYGKYNDEELQKIIDNGDNYDSYHPLLLSDRQREIKSQILQNTHDAKQKQLIKIYENISKQKFKNGGSIDDLQKFFR